MDLKDFMIFRTVYLRSIAESWVDEKFKRKLLAAPEDAMDDRFKWKWPWKSVGLKIKESPDFKWLNDEWVWPPGLLERLRLPVPLDPDVYKISSRDQARALADYYQQRRSLFTSGPTVSCDPCINSPDDPDAESVPSATQQGPVEPCKKNGSVPFVPADHDFYDFQTVLIKAIAKAWRDPDFRELLKIDSLKAMGSIKGYRVPWNFFIDIEEEDEDTKWSREQGWDLKGKYQIELNLPSKPSEVADEPVALAAYNATGAEYPFSCCT